MKRSSGGRLRSATSTVSERKGRGKQKANSARAAVAQLALLTAWLFGACLCAVERASADERPYASTGSTPCTLTGVHGENLNPRGMVLSHPELCEAVVSLYSEIRRLMPDTDFRFEVSGGDRYRDEFGAIRSSTDFQVIPDSAPLSQHIEGTAVDIIVGAPREIVLRARERSPFRGGYISDHYFEHPHWHFALPRQRTLASS